MKTIDKLRRCFAEIVMLWRGLNLQEQLDAVDGENESFLKRAIKYQKFDDEAVIKLFLFSSLGCDYYKKHNCSNVVKTAILQSSNNDDFGISLMIIMDFNFIKPSFSVSDCRLLCLKILLTEDDKIISFFQKVDELEEFKCRVDEAKFMNNQVIAWCGAENLVTFNFVMGENIGSTSLYTPINMEWIGDKIAEYIPNEVIQKKIVAINEKILTDTMLRKLTELEVWWQKSFDCERKFLMI